MAAYYPETWQKWMRAALDGDAQAYRDLLMSIRPFLVGYFSRRLNAGHHGQAEVEDLVQMTLLSLHEKRATYDRSAPFVPWLMAVARHKLIDYVRKTKKAVHVELDDSLCAVDGYGPALARRDVAILLTQLPRDQARVIRLHKLKELNVEEVSRVTGHSMANVRVMVHRGVKRLQALIAGGAL
ncbi:sigma-70 family RNA polymerase sigma factor [Asticcacaulis sp. SL142]|uniref:sigma-70 family RNA polymerase sigma factor n=1 Tax=Asticcacaulis sp. SL142 TaxID=2995155 RepID=UPI00226D2853|nr:sigma-70 family RNA polymerase sigma factor [Asticcacaulis sp. SL142]WAC49845.1 sigma-70 family RNA polymerase sigma factor [Asticcacaulis sp. SL142]